MIDDKLFRVIAKILSVSPDLVTINSVPGDFENWDSLRHTNIIFAVEEEFDINFTDTQIDELISVHSFYDAVSQNLTKS